jgi:nitrate/nitrite transporter NarK
VLALIAACLLGGTAGWSLTATGAAAVSLAGAYEVNLVVVGLLTTAFGIVYALFQIPAGIITDRIGIRRAGAMGLTIVIVVYLGAGTFELVGLALAARALAGIGGALCYVAGADLARVSGTGTVGQGIYGGVASAAGGVALVVVPSTEGVLGWRASWLTSAVFACLGLAVCLGFVSAHGTGARRAGAMAAGEQPLLRDPGLYWLAAVHAVTFGIGIVLSNWTALILQRSWGLGSVTAHAVASIILLATVVSRPLGGLIVRRRPRLVRPLTVGSLIVGAVATILIDRPGPLVLAIGITLALGLAAGIPFAAVFAITQRRRADRPAAAIGFLNAHANLIVVAGVPAVGATVGGAGLTPALFVIAGLWLIPLYGLLTDRTVPGHEPIFSLGQNAAAAAAGAREAGPASPG